MKITRSHASDLRQVTQEVKTYPLEHFSFWFYNMLNGF